jgi:protein AbiQ
MRFYNIKDDYITFLRSFDTKVAENKHEARPYVGVVLEINGIHYYAPFTSPKPKHQKMKNGKDFRKINQGIYGAINFNNMIPVVTEALIEIDINNMEDEKYKNLLLNQLSYVRADKTQIEKVASELHTLLLTPDVELSKYNLQVKQRCCNIKVLEANFLNYKK